MDLSRILIWNVRGLNRRSHHDSVRNLVGTTQSDIVCLQETKKAAISRHMVLSLLGVEYDEFLVLPALDTRGGVPVAWKGNICKAIHSRVDVFSISVCFDLEGAYSW
jgi:exonuclease III